MLSEYLYQLRDTLIMSGVDRKFADLLVNPDAIGEAEIDELQIYNSKLINAAKGRLHDLNKLAVITGHG